MIRKKHCFLLITFFMIKTMTLKAEQVWDSTWGTIRVIEDGEVVKAVYDDKKDGFIILNYSSGDTFKGFWIKTTSAKKCRTKKLNERTGEKTAYWGSFTVKATDTQFVGLWGYCKRKPTEKWTGKIK